MSEDQEKTQQIGSYLIRGSAIQISDGPNSEITDKWQARCTIRNTATKQEQLFGSLRFYADTIDEAAAFGLNYGVDLVNQVRDGLKI